MAKLLPTQCVIAAFNNEEAADAMSHGLAKAVRESNIPPFRNLAVARKDASGKVSVSEMGNATAFAGGTVGAVVGGLACVLLGPAGMAAGAAAGAIIGHSGTKALVEGSLDKDRVRQFGNSLPTKSSGIIVVFEEVPIQKEIWKDVVVQQVRDDFLFELSKNMGDTLRGGQDVAYLISISEEGVAAARMGVGEEVMDIESIFANADGVVAGQAVVTEDAIVYEVAAGAAGNESIEAAYKAGVITEEHKATLTAAAAIEVDEESK